MSSLLVHRWSGPLVEGVLEQRYERFLATVRLRSGETVRAHCVNPGRMEGLVIPGARVWLSESKNPKRALRHTWELIETDAGLVGANTVLPNLLVRRVLEQGLLSGFEGARAVRPEQPLGRSHRVDFVVEQDDGPHHVEVKNCHLVYPDGRGYFPDSVSERAESHVEALARLAKRGERTTVLFTVQRPDARALRPSDLHAPGFARAVRKAARAGVAFRALSFTCSLDGVAVRGELPVELDPYPLEPVRAFSRALEETSGWQRKDGRWAGRAVG